MSPKLVSAQFREKLALTSINITRSAFDIATGYGPNMDEKKWLRRIIFLETVAGALML